MSNQQVKSKTNNVPHMCVCVCVYKVNASKLDMAEILTCSSHLVKARVHIS